MGKLDADGRRATV
jgi:hypothetical protein